jgi:hypothetical protein
MTVPEDGVLRRLALTALAHHAGPAASADVLAGAAVTSLECRLS